MYYYKMNPEPINEPIKLTPIPIETMQNCVFTLQRQQRDLMLNLTDKYININFVLRMIKFMNKLKFFFKGVYPHSLIRRTSSQIFSLLTKLST